MNKIEKIFTFLCLCVFAFEGCDREAALHELKVYMEDAGDAILIEDGVDSYEIELKSRLTSVSDREVNVAYTIEGESLVEAYNAKYGKQYKSLSGVTLESSSSVISAGGVYANTVVMHLDNLDEQLVPGESFLVPVRVSAAEVPVIEGSDVVYYEVKKPLKILKAASFNYSYITVPITPLDKFDEVTYEAVVNISRFGDNNTVMGCEGVMIMRIGDAGGGTVPRDILQMAGNSEMTWTGNPLQAGQWYHLAFTCSADGKGMLYVNGECVVEGSFTMSSDLTANGADYGFSIGQVPNFKWGTRPFTGLMSEVRLWNVVRTPAQIKENMLNVNPETPGLVAYYKLNGELKNAAADQRPIKSYNISFTDLQKPVAIGGGL